MAKRVSSKDRVFIDLFQAMKTECKKGRIIPKNIHEGPLKLMGRYRLLNEEDSANMGTLPNTGMLKELSPFLNSGGHL